MKKALVLLLALLLTLSACSNPKIVKVEETAEAAPVLLPTESPLPSEEPAQLNEIYIPMAESASTESPLDPTEQPALGSVFTPGVVSGTEIVFEEDFSEPNPDWSSGSNERVKRDYVNGEFTINIVTDNRKAWSYVINAVYNHDVVLDVDVRGGTDFPEDGEAGFVCGYENNKNFYGMNVGADGYMEFFREVNDEREKLYKAYDVTPLNPAGTHLTGVCTQTELRLYVNGQLVATQAIDSLPVGTAGLLGGSNDTGNLELYFDNFTISKGPYIFGDSTSLSPD